MEYSSWSDLTSRQKFDRGILIIISVLASVVVFQQAAINKGSDKCDTKIIEIQKVFNTERVELKNELKEEKAGRKFEADRYVSHLESLAARAKKLEKTADSLKQKTHGQK